MPTSRLRWQSLNVLVKLFLGDVVFEDDSDLCRVSTLSFGWLVKWWLEGVTCVWWGGGLVCEHQEWGLVIAIAETFPYRDQLGQHISIWYDWIAPCCIGHQRRVPGNRRTSFKEPGGVVGELDGGLVNSLFYKHLSLALSLVLGWNPPEEALRLNGGAGKPAALASWLSYVRIWCFTVSEL